MTRQQLADSLGLPLYVVESWPLESSGRTTIDGIEYATDSQAARDAVARADAAMSGDEETWS